MLRAFYTRILRYIISFTRMIGSKSLKLFAIGKRKGANSVSKIESINFLTARSVHSHRLYLLLEFGKGQ